MTAAKLGKQVAIVDRAEMVGGACLHTETIPSKTLRESILYLSGFRQRAFYGQDYTLKEDISVADLATRVATVRTREMSVIKDQLRRNGIAIISGTARFIDPHSSDPKTGSAGRDGPPHHVFRFRITRLFAGAGLENTVGHCLKQCGMD